MNITNKASLINTYKRFWFLLSKFAVGGSMVKSHFLIFERLIQVLFSRTTEIPVHGYSDLRQRMIRDDFVLDFPRPQFNVYRLLNFLNTVRFFEIKSLVHAQRGCHPQQRPHSPPSLREATTNWRTKQATSVSKPGGKGKWPGFLRVPISRTN